MSNSTEFLLQQVINENDALKMVIEDRDATIMELADALTKEKMKKVGITSLRSSLKSIVNILEGDGKLVDRMILVAGIAAQALTRSERYM